MQKFDQNSEKFTEYLKSFELCHNFLYQEPDQSPKEVSAQLHRCTLKIFTQTLLIQSVPIDKSFRILQENLQKYEFLITCQESDEVIEFKLTAYTLDQFILWKQAFQVSKRPENVNLPNCFLCSKHFNIFRRKYNCKHCGNPMCSKCCPYQAIISHLGYSKKQSICTECVHEIRNTGPINHLSLFLSNKKIDTRSVLE